MDLAYYMSQINTIASPDYIPTHDDILHARQRSTGATETAFVVNKCKITLHDMGGQLNERNKWHHLLTTKIQGLFFFVAVDEYNTPSTEEANSTKLQLALRTWVETLTEWEKEARTMSIFVVFNKVDLLDIKLKENFVSFKDCYPDYSGDQTREGVLKYIEKMFRAVAPFKLHQKYIVFFPGCALDQGLMKKIFEETKAQLIHRRIASDGLL